MSETIKKLPVTLYADAEDLAFWRETLPDVEILNEIQTALDERMAKGPPGPTPDVVYKRASIDGLSVYSDGRGRFYAIWKDVTERATVKYPQIEGKVVKRFRARIDDTSIKGTFVECYAVLTWLDSRRVRRFEVDNTTRALTAALHIARTRS